MKRLGVDIGGTFTDLVVYDEETGEVVRTKASTTPRAPDEGLLRACRQVDVKMHEVTHFMHATTLVTNMLINRSGAKVGLITTKGFRDVLEIGRTYRDELYNLQWDKPVPFVPRYLVMEVTERVDSKGSAVVGIDRGEVASRIQELLGHGVESIAVSLFNSYANDSHEQIIKEILAEAAPDIHVSLSTEVDPRIREFQRVSTTVLNAYAMPRTHDYIERLDKALGVNVKYMHSGGGIVPSVVAKQLPVTMVSSGPTAGVLAAKFVGEKIGLNNLITADVGGTSFDVCVIRDGQPDIKDQIEVEWGIPARIQAVDVTSIGAGGGSIAWIDEGGVLRVGPQSAGAEPGPACYDRGGTKPTVTDANMVLGMLNPENLLGGSLKVAPEKAWESISPIAEHFGVSVPEAAQGIYRIVNANMAQAILEATVKKGIDPRDFTLVSFGGAGGQHAVDVAREAAVPTVLFPRMPSTFSAFGLLTADLKNTVSRTVLMPLAKLDVKELRQALRVLEKNGKQFLADERKSIIGTEIQHILDVRYIGQSNEVAVPLSDKIPLRKANIYAEFERIHHILFGTQLGDPAEIVNVRVTVTGFVRSVDVSAEAKRASSKKPKAKGRRKSAFYPKELAVFDREDLEYGMVIKQPCIIEEVDSTNFISKGCVARIDKFGNMIVDLPKEKWARALSGE